MRRAWVGLLLVAGCGSATGPERRVSTCPFVLRVDSTLHVVKPGVKVWVVDTVRRCL